MHWQKSGLKIIASAVNKYQLWFGAEPFLFTIQADAVGNGVNSKARFIDCSSK